MPTYSIKNGDNLTRLAKRFGTTVSALAQANSIADPDKIFVGDTIDVPDQQAAQLQALVMSLLGQQGGPSPTQQLPPEMMPPQQDPRQVMGGSPPQMGGLGAMANPMPQGPQGSPAAPPQVNSAMPPVGNSRPFSPSMPIAMVNPQGGLGATAPRPDQARTELLRQYGMMR